MISLSFELSFKKKWLLSKIFGTKLINSHHLHENYIGIKTRNIWIKNDCPFFSKNANYFILKYKEKFFFAINRNASLAPSLVE